MRPVTILASALFAAVLAEAPNGSAQVTSGPSDDSTPLRGAPTGVLIAPSAGTEVGYGNAYPSLGTPVAQVLGRLGVSLEFPSSWTLVGGLESGATVAMGTGMPHYGYLFRIPFKGFAEAILSRRVDYRSKRFINLHFGGTYGQEFSLAAQCNTDGCNYLPAGLHTGFGGRVGLSFSQGSRSSIGLFLRWDGDVGECGGASCQAFLQTFTWNLGWTLF